MPRTWFLRNSHAAGTDFDIKSLFRDGDRDSGMGLPSKSVSAPWKSGTMHIRGVAFHQNLCPRHEEFMVSGCEIWVLHWESEMPG